MTVPKPGPFVALRKASARWRRRGSREVLSEAGRRLREAVWSADTLVFMARTAAGRFDPPAHDRELGFREASPSDGLIYERFIGTESPDTFALRLEAGARCFFVTQEEMILHSTWATEKAAWTREIRRYFCPPPGDAYVYESFTRPEARGRGVYPFALTRICERLAEEGMGLVWVGVEGDNQPSRKAIGKAHFSEQFRVRYARKLGFLRVDEPEGEGVRLCLGCLAQRI